MCREEDIAAWTKDIKESDYTTIKEKVSTLEQGLQAIGLAQVLSIHILHPRMQSQKKIVTKWPFKRNNNLFTI